MIPPQMTPPPMIDPPEVPTSENGMPVLGFLGNAKVTVFLYFGSVIAYGLQFAGAFGVDVPKQVAGGIALGAFILGTINHQLNAAKKKTPPAMIALTLGASLFAAHAAFAAPPALTVGPSLPMVEITPGDKHPVSLAPGAGVAVGADFFPAELFGRQVAALTLTGDVFGAVVTNGPTIAANLSVALMAVVYELFGFGVGAKLYDTAGSGLINGTASARSFFFLVRVDYGFLNALIVGHSGGTPVQADPPIVVPGANAAAVSP